MKTKLIVLAATVVLGFAFAGSVVQLTTPAGARDIDTSTALVVIFASCTQWNDPNCEKRVPVSPLRPMEQIPDVGDTIEFEVGSQIRSELIVSRVWGVFDGDYSDYGVEIYLESAGHLAP